MMDFIYSIKFRFTLWYLAILSILLVIMAWGVYSTLSRTLYSNFDETLRTRAAQLSGFKDIISIVAEGMFEEEPGEVVVFFYQDKDHQRHISQKKLSISIDQVQIDQAIAGKSSYTTIQTGENRWLRIYATPYIPDNPRIRPLPPPPRSHEFERHQGGERPGRLAQFDRLNNIEKHPPPRKRHDRVDRDEEFDRPPPPLLEIHQAALVIGRPISDIELTLNRLLNILCLAVPLTITLSGGGGVFLARRAFRPVEKITETAREIEESDLSRRIDVTSKDELGKLAASLNQMIARLESAFTRQKEFTSDASHELRAPLAVIQAEATLTLQREREAFEYRESLKMISRESENMAAIINQLLTLARADKGKENPEFEKIDLADFVKNLCADIDVVCREKNISLQVECFHETLIKGERRSLCNLFQNLLSNAINYTATEGTISVVTRRQDAWAVVSITDTGIGIPLEEQALIFERFYRVDKARSRSDGGSGLGLSICHHIIEMHGGRIEVESQLDAGSTFHVWLPVT